MVDKIKAQNETSKSLSGTGFSSKNGIQLQHLETPSTNQVVPAERSPTIWRLVNFCDVELSFCAFTFSIKWYKISNVHLNNLPGVTFITQEQKKNVF